MSTQGELHIDSSHCRAICDEIGARLRAILDRELPAMPPQLQLIVDRLAEKDRELAPSIVPSMDDMVWQPAGSNRVDAGHLTAGRSKLHA